MPRWDWERRRDYLTYHALRNIVLTISGFVEQYGNAYGPHQYDLLRQLLTQNTGLNFPPVQQPYRNIFRNYKRLLYCLNLATVERNRVILLPNGQWVADNDPPEGRFFHRIIDTFCYPNPAFQSYIEWVDSGRKLTPMKMLLRCLRALELADPQNAYFTPEEVTNALYNSHDNLEDRVLAQAVLTFRNGHSAPPELPRFTPTDEDRRQVREILSFMNEIGVISSQANRVLENTRFVFNAENLAIAPVNQVPPTRQVISNAFEVIEGDIFYENRRSRRRNSQLREHALRHYGYVCSVCEIDYSIYGELGQAAVDVHHLYPIADRIGNEITTLDDVRILCATCHRMIHAGGQLRTPDELKILIEEIRRERE